MNAWHIVTSEYPPDVGGVSDYTLQIAEGLARMGDEVHVWCPRPTDRASSARLHVHPDLGGITRADLRRIDAHLGDYPVPRRLLVQWVPHGFGYHSMNVWFCFWLAKRAWRGDQVELMVHEPFLEFYRGPLRHLAMACVHRVMTMVLLGAARKVWMSIPAWERRLRPYALWRRLPMQWLPIPGCVASESGASASAIRLRYVTGGRHLLGHFGSYGPDVTALLLERLPPVMDGPLGPSLLLLGSGSAEFHEVLVSRKPAWATRVHASGYLASGELSAHIAACDLFVQPYPDGITSRRTSAMACLSRGRPVVTTSGHLTESLWAETGAVAAVDVADPAAFASETERLLVEDIARLELGARGQRLYDQRFSVSDVVKTLRAA